MTDQFELLPKILHEPFLVITPIGDNVKVERVCGEVYEIVVSPFEIMLRVFRFKS